jgi:hypothetical protein
MRQAILVGCLGCLLGAAVTSTARAQQTDDGASQSHETVPQRLEVEAAGDYLFGTGAYGARHPYDGLPGSGIGVALGLDYRLSWRWALGIQGQYYDSSSDPSSPARSLGANLGATWHFHPSPSFDPWVRFATGYRLLWENDPTGAMFLRHGLELATLTAGYDAALSRTLAIAPVIGAGLDMFLWQDPPSTVSPPFSAQTGLFVSAGLQGRFAFGGT